MQHLQVEHKAWVDANFPQQPPHLPAAGMVEEAGELLHALIAKYRIARWGADRRYSLDKLDADLQDAIGDCAIYFVSYCNAAEWDFYKLLKSSPTGNAEKRPHIDTGVLLVSVAAAFYVAQTKDVAKQYLTLLQQLAADCGYEFTKCVESTWNTVKERKR